MPEIKLVYFNYRAKAEHIRYILKHANVEFKEEWISFEDWPNLKSSMPMAQLPVLEVDGKRLCQSTAIARYLANEYGLNADSDMDRALCDMYVDGIHGDLYSQYAHVYMHLVMGETMETAIEEYAKFKPEKLKSFLDRYEQFLVDNGTGFLVGNKVTWADLTLAEMLERFQRCWDSNALEGHPKLVALVKTVHELPNIRNYVDSRPERPF